MVLHNGSKKRITRVLAYQINKKSKIVIQQIDLPEYLYSNKMKGAYFMGTDNVFMCAPRTNVNVGISKPYLAEYIPEPYN